MHTVYSRVAIFLFVVGMAFFVFYIYRGDINIPQVSYVFADREKREVESIVARVLFQDEKTSHADMSVYSNRIIVEQEDGSYAVTAYPSVVFISTSSPVYTNIHLSVDKKRKTGSVTGYDVEGADADFTAAQIGTVIPAESIVFFTFSPESAEVIDFIDQTMKRTEPMDGYDFSEGIITLAKEAPFIIKDRGEQYVVYQSHLGWSVHFTVEKETGLVGRPLIIHFDER